MSCRCCCRFIGEDVVRAVLARGAYGSAWDGLGQRQQPPEPEPEPWTFADLGMGDWFEDKHGEVWQRVERFNPAPHPWANARRMNGQWGRFDDATIVHPFEWEWVA